jgi:hypothetical protein
LLYTETLKAEENPKLRDPSARQIDFRQFFPPPPDISPLNDPIPGPELLEIAQRRSGNPLRCASIGGSDWVNGIFVLVTILGGLFLSVRYLGGPETFRSTTKWSREFLYQRPASIESYAKIDIPALSQRDALSPKPAPILQLKENSDGRDALAQVKHPLIAPPPSPANNSLPFVPATTSNSSSAGSQENAARGVRGSSQASNSGATGGKTGTSGPSAPTSAGPTDKDPKTPAGPSRRNPGVREDSKSGKENCVKPDNRQITNAQKLARIESVRRAQENLARVTRSVNGPTGGNFRAFNSNRAGSFGAPGNGVGGRH